MQTCIRALAVGRSPIVMVKASPRVSWRRAMAASMSLATWDWVAMRWSSRVIVRHNVSWLRWWARRLG